MRATPSPRPAMSRSVELPVEDDVAVSARDSGSRKPRRRQRFAEPAAKAGDAAGAEREEPEHQDSAHQARPNNARTGGGNAIGRPEASIAMSEVRALTRRRPSTALVTR